MMKGLIYYTDFHLDSEIHRICLEQLKKSFSGEIVSVSLNKSLDFGKNIVLEGERSNVMMVKQILTALENITSDVVFFCEHDVLYDPSHFLFTPTKQNVFYYNLSNWRWDYPKDRIISYDGLTSLSQMCSYREWVLDHYRQRLKKIIDSGWDREELGKMQPSWIRKLGYEPGTKRKRIGGFSDDVNERFKSEFPNIDIRHDKTLSNRKVKLSHFKHQPKGWKEESLDYITNFKLKEMFNIINL